MKLRHGFKSFSEEIAREARLELGLDEDDPLDPFALAAHLAIPVAPFRHLVELGVSPASVQILIRRGSPISAFTAFVGYRKLIYYNDGHATSRTANSVSHELAHVLLEHEPAKVAVPAHGAATWDPVQEHEADWLGGALLVPRCAALHWLEAGRGLEEGAIYFGVSVSLFRWRVNHTGVATQLRRRANYR